MLNVQDLRKIFSAQGVKGFGSANRAKFTEVIEAAHAEALELNAALAPAPVAAPAAPKKGICEDCGRKVGKSGHPTLCEICLDYAGWENTHQDGHDGEDTETMAACPVCHPELDARTAKPTGRSRMGMVIVAKGTEIHKSATFKTAAEAAGWSVNILGSVVADEEVERYVAIATKDGKTIELAWNGRAYDYHASSAVLALNGKARKVRNLKEALRLL